MTEEDFFNAYYFYNQEVLETGRYVHLGYRDYPGEIMPIVHAVSEKRIDKSLPQGEKELRIDINDNERTIERTLAIIEEKFANPTTIIQNSEFSLDYRFLEHQQVINFLNNCRENGYISSLKIVGDSYTLDAETYEQLREFPTIRVANSEVNRENVIEEARNYEFIYGINDDINIEADLILKSDMSDEELRQIIEIFNGLESTSDKKLQIRFYNPAVTVELIERLDRLGLNQDIRISILGYPLTETSEGYERLEEIANRRKIDVTYVCCHDLLESYCDEPYLIDNQYFSELEPDGKTDFKTYMKILRFVEDFQRNVQDVDSNVERTMMAYQYLNDNYYYDLNAGTTKDYGATRDVDKLLDTDEIVCAGYANLLTIMCRRVGIPMFTFGAPGHRMNVARIVEKNEDGEVVLDKICTFDATNDSGYYVEDILSPTGQRREEIKDSYTFFGLDPERYLHQSDPSYMTLANGLAIPRDDFISNAIISHSPFGAGYVGGYDASSYMYSMLHLMGYNYDPARVDMFDLIAQLQEEGRIGEIPNDFIYRAANNIQRRKNGQPLSTEARDRVDASLDLRGVVFKEPTARLLLNRTPNQDVINIATYKTNMPRHEYVDIASLDIGPVYYQDHGRVRNGAPITSEPFVEPIHEEPVEQSMFTEEDFSEEYIAGTTIRRPRARGIYETDEEYVAFLERYYNYYFPEATQQTNTTYSLTRDQIIQDPPINQPVEQPMFTEEDYSDEYIEGTNIRKPRVRGIYETDEEYVEFLERFYNHHFPNHDNSSTYSLTRDQIIQDPPIHQPVEQPMFREEDYGDEYIEGTNIRKPRVRGIYETDEEYVEFLERFYNHHFPNVEPVTVRIFGDVDTYTEEDFSEGYIPHTNIRRPRERGIYESDEEYVEFLENFYNHYFPNSSEYTDTNGRSR